MTDDNKIKAATTDEIVVPHREETLAEIHARGGQAFSPDFLKKASKTLEEALDAFGDCTPDEFRKLSYLHTMATETDKVYTNPNLVQGVQTINTAGIRPGSVHEQVVRHSFEKADKKRSFFDTALKGAGEFDTTTPEWQRSGNSPAPAPAPAAAPAVAPENEETGIEELVQWCLSGKKSQAGRMVTRSFTVEKEVSTLVDALSEKLSESYGYEMGAALIIRRAMKMGLVELFKQEEARLKDGSE